MQILFNYLAVCVIAIAFWRIYRLGVSFDALYQDHIELKNELSNLTEDNG
jgi:hypothetical protein